MIKSSLFSLLEKLIKLTSGLVSVFLVANIMGAQKYGEFQLTISWISIFSCFTMFGLPGVVSKHINKNNINNYSIIFSGIIIKICLSIFSILILSSLVYFQYINVNNEYYMVLMLIPIFNSYLIINSFLETVNNSKVFFKFSFFTVFIGLTTRLVIYYFKLSIDYFVYIYAIEILLLFLFNTSFLINHFNHLKPKFDKSLIKKSSYFGFAAIAFIVVGNIDQLVLSYFYDDGIVGKYSLSYRIILLIYGLSSPISNGLFRRLKENNRDSILWSSLFSIHLFLSLIIIITYFLIGKRIVTAIVSFEYLETIKYLDSLIVILPFLLLTIPIGKWLLINNKGKFFFKRALLSIFINLITNIILIKFLGVYAVIIGTLLTYIWLSVICFFIESELNELKNIFILSVKNIFKIKTNLKLLYGKNK